MNYELLDMIFMITACENQKILLVILYRYGSL